MKSTRIAPLLALFAAFGGPQAYSTAQQPMPVPSHIFDLSKSVPDWGKAPYPNGSVVFLEENIAAVGLCNKVGCSLATFDLTDGNSHLIAVVNGQQKYRAILRSRDGRLVLTNMRQGENIGNTAFDADLHGSEWFPVVPGVSARGDNIPDGQGRRIDHAGSVAAYTDGGVVKINGPNGALLGSFKMAPADAMSVRIIADDRLILKKSGRLVVSDYNGKTLQTLKWSEDGWRGRLGQSANGDRLLFDDFTRHVGLAQSLKEKALILPTMGLSADGYVPNQETVHVVDSLSGQGCFEWTEKSSLLPPFGIHADVNPSGKLVAVLTQRFLTIYALPETCAD